MTTLYRDLMEDLTRMQLLFTQVSRHHLHLVLDGLHPPALVQ